MRYLLIRLPLMVLLAAALVDASPSNIDSLYYFYERTLYLEDLTQDGAWWSNPARLASIDAPAVLTVNTGLLGGKYSMSGIRAMFPTHQTLCIGFGLTGTSTHEGRSFVGDESGGTMTSNFNFSRPSLEAGISHVLGVGGTIGAMVITGTESFMSPHDGIRRYYFILGTGGGYLSPALFGVTRLSLATLSVRHFQFDGFWDHGAKLGVLLILPDSLLQGSLEYAFPLPYGFKRLAGQRTPYYYAVVKGSLLLRIRSIAGVRLGWSSDTKNFRDNGPTLHGGVELRPSSTYHYWGGYEIGVSPWSSRHQLTSPGISVLHRFWVGYAFKKDDH